MYVCTQQANRKEQEEFEEQMVTLGRIMDSELQMPVTTNPLLSRSKSLTRAASNQKISTLGSSSSSSAIGQGDKSKDGKDDNDKDDGESCEPDLPSTIENFQFFIL